jgi:hypothetical protein
MVAEKKLLRGFAPSEKFQKGKMPLCSPPYLVDAYASNTYKMLRTCVEPIYDLNPLLNNHFKASAV